MNDVAKEICQQIKEGIDAARTKGVWCSYPIGVWISDQCHQWPFPEPSPRVENVALAMATFETGSEVSK